MFFKDQGQQILTANSTTILGAQGRLATLLVVYVQKSDFH